MITLTQEPEIASLKRRAFDDAIAEQYYSLVHWIQSGREPSTSGCATIGVAGCSSGAGTSTVALNLAVAATHLGDQAVLLLDLSAHGRLASRLGVSGDAGLGTALAPDARPAQCPKPTSVPNLFLLGSSDARTLALDRRKVHELLHTLESDFGLIVVDLPTTESSLCFGVAGLLDGVLLTMEAERTRRCTAAKAQQRLTQAQANVLGVILNKQRQHIPSWLDSKL